MNENPSQTQFENLADEFAEEIRAGKRPAIEDYAQRHPGLADKVRRLFPVLQMMEQHGQEVEDPSEERLMQAELERLRKTPPLRKLGDYSIIREIGRGGMGIVFEAQQESLGRRVALKVLPQSAQLDDRLRARFEHEARASAMLHHTNIVPIFGVGHERDTSYFVMQYIDGQPLDRVLHELSRQSESPASATAGGATSVATVVSQLSQQSQESPQDATVVEAMGQPEASTAAEERLPSQDLVGDSSSGVESIPGESSYWRSVARIGIQVASALQYAHSRKILHRDIKPANLLLDKTGCAWITDFGLAKCLESPNLTRTGEVLGTLRYMSPEQLDGAGDERSDLFALGLTLYEMACLQPAYPANDRNLLLRQVADAAPRGLRTQSKKIPRDLETIIHKCIASDPKNRYQHAQAVADDLQRFLNGQAIMARRINWMERTVKWCRRRPAVAALLVALTAVALAGVGGISWQLQQTSNALSLAQDNLTESNRQKLRAQAHFEQAREAVNRFFTVVSQERLLQEPGLQPLRKELLTEAQDYHTQFVAQYRDDAELKFELAKSLFQIAEIEGTLNSSPEVADQVDEPIQIFSELIESNPQDPMPRMFLARSLGLQNNIVRRFDTVRGMALLQESIAQLEILRAEFPETKLGLSDLARQYQMLGLAFESEDRATQRTDRSLECYLKSHDLRTELLADAPDNIELRIQLADVKRDLGITYRRMAELDTAEAYYLQAIEQLQQIVDENPDHMLAKKTLGSIANTTGYYYGTGAKEKDYQQALFYYDMSHQQYQDLADKNPQIIEFQDGVARAALNAGGIYQVLNDMDRALERRRFAADVREKLVLLNPDAAYLRSSWAISLNGVGSTLRDLGRLEEAEEMHRQALEQHSLALAQDPKQAMIRMRLVDGLIQIARTQSAAEQFDQAVRTVESIEEVNAEDFSRAYYLEGLEMIIIASKIGSREGNQLTAELQTLSEACLEKARWALGRAWQLGFDVAREIRLDPSFASFQKYPEFQQQLAWLDEQ